MPEAAAFADWLTTEGRATNTVAAYRRDVEAFLRWRDEQPGASLADYVAELRRSRRPSSAARAVVALRIYHRWAGEDAHAIPALRGVPLAEEPEGDTLDEAAVGQLFAAASGDAVERRRDAVAVGLLYFGGLKAGEAISVDLADITADEGLLTVDRDGVHERVLPVVPDLQEILRRWLAPGGRARLQPTSEAVLLNRRGRRLTRQGLWLVTNGVAQRAGIGDALSPNALRRACGAHLTERGLDASAVAAFLGHTPRQPPGARMLNETGWGSCNLAI